MAVLLMAESDGGQLITKRGMLMAQINQFQEITKDVAREYAVFAMMASNSYHKPDRVCFPVELLGWHQVDLAGNPTDAPTQSHTFSGLAYDFYEKIGTNRMVIAFRGTDDLIRDYLWANLALPPWNLQYRQARNEVGAYMAAHTNKNITVVGHSLGGGLALCVSVHHGLQAITFNPSPRVFDGIGDFHEPAERVIFFEDDEILEIVRKFWRKDNEIVSEKDVYQCKYKIGHKPVEAHRSDFLVFGMLQQAASIDQQLNQVLIESEKRLNALAKK